ncbi:MAG: hypothetical protein JXR77_12190 [Lentisphaeria bacterium]|nr:hypothetical protein [Lentisphaeria bacterium]
MYPMEPDAVYVHETVWRHGRYRAGVERVLGALERPVAPIEFRDDDIPEMVRGGLLRGRGAMGCRREVRDPILLFNTFRFDRRRAERLAWLKGQGIETGDADMLLGYGAFRWANYNQDGDPNRQDKVCRPCWRIHLQKGCLHRCMYCGLGGILGAMVNVDEYAVHLRTLVERHPWQLTYLLDDDADPPGLEPELGSLGELIEFFGTLENRYLIIHTKTWNTAWLEGLRHNGNTILVWSLSGPTQSRAIEPRAGTTEQRIEAARIAQEAGYTIRYKFKPIIPVRGWREEAAETVELLFRRTRPDVISLCCFMWMSVDEMKRRLPVETLDPDALAAAEGAVDRMKDTRAMPFPPEMRQAIYEHHLAEIRRWNADVPVSLSTENFAMWREMSARLGYGPTDYPCGCGPMTVPGAPRLTCHPFRDAVRNDRGEIPGVW